MKNGISDMPAMKMVTKASLSAIPGLVILDIETSSSKDRLDPLSQESARLGLPSAAARQLAGQLLMAVDELDRQAMGGAKSN